MGKEKAKKYYDQKAKDHMISFSLGVDIEDVKRFAKLNPRKDTLFGRVFTKREIEYCRSKPNPSQHFAARFAGKEAVIKLITYFGKKIRLDEIEILNDENGVPTVFLINEEFSDIKILISLSHCKDNAIAFALGVKNGPY